MRIIELVPACPPTASGSTTSVRSPSDAAYTAAPSPDGPRASLVALDNDTGEVLAMVGGDDYATRPFNLATQGQRQPGSSFKPFILAEALTQGISADSTWASRQIDLCVAKTKKGRCKEYFNVNNYEDAYAGVQSCANLRSAGLLSGATCGARPARRHRRSAGRGRCWS